MKIKQPKDLREALSILNEQYNDKEEDLNYFKSLPDGNGVHFTFGMWLRNNWLLWEQKTPIVVWFKNTYGIYNADDISGIILDTWHRQLNGLTPRVEELVTKYKAHWEKNGGLN